MGEEKQLKSGWQMVKFGDVVRLSKERSKDPEADGIERYIGLEHIDEIVRLVRFPDWQHSNVGEREVKQALRKTLLKYKLHQDKDLFGKAYEYIRQYY